MKIKKEMYSPESTSGASGAKGKYSANILLQDLEEDDEKTLSSNLNETASDDSDNSDIDSDKSSTPTQQIATPKGSEGSFIGSEAEVGSIIYAFITMIHKIKINLNLFVASLYHVTKNFHR